MKANVVRFVQTGGPEVLKLVEADVRDPGPGELRMKVRAIGLNRAESMFRLDQYLESPQLPAGLGYEAAGTVESVGSGVKEFAVGDAVSVIPGFSMNRYSCYGEVAVVPAASTVKHPPNLDWNSAAASWMQYMTAYGALIDVAKLARGDTILITAAPSSVGLAAIQIANSVGATPIASTRKAEKEQALLSHGAKHVVVVPEQEIDEEVRRLTGGKGARVIFDPIGGPGLEQLANAAAYEGIILEYGALSKEPTPFPLFAAIGNGLTIRGFTLMELKPGTERFESAKQFVLKGLASGVLKPVIDKTFPLSQIAAVHRYLESNQQVGKIVVTVEER